MSGRAGTQIALRCQRILPDCTTSFLFHIFSHSTGFWLLPQQTRGWAGWGSAAFCRRRSSARRHPCEVQSCFPHPALALLWAGGAVEFGGFRENRECCWVPRISKPTVPVIGSDVWRLQDLFCHSLSLLPKLCWNTKFLFPVYSLVLWLLITESSF